MHNFPLKWAPNICMSNLMIKVDTNFESILQLSCAVIQRKIKQEFKMSHDGSLWHQLINFDNLETTHLNTPICIPYHN